MTSQYLLVLWTQYLPLTLLGSRVLRWTPFLRDVRTIRSRPRSIGSRTETTESRTMFGHTSRIVTTLSFWYPLAFPSHARYAGQPELILIIIIVSVRFIFFVVLIGVPVIVRIGKERRVGAS